MWGAGGQAPAFHVRVYDGLGKRFRDPRRREQRMCFFLLAFFLRLRHVPAGRREWVITMAEWLIPLAVLGVWVFLQAYLLPKLGMDT